MGMTIIGSIIVLALVFALPLAGIIKKKVQEKKEVQEEKKKEQALAQKERELLQDETIMKYYEMIYNMKKSFLWYGDESTDENSRARRYIELLLKGPCEEEKFVKAVELINLSQKENLLKEIRESFEKNLRYTCDKQIACRTCYKELLEEIKAEYEEILDVIKDKITCEVFIHGLKKKILDKYDKYGITSAEYKVARECIQIAISDSFLEGNAITRKILFDLMLDSLKNWANASDRIYNHLKAVEHITLCALHFEEYGQDRDGYTSLTLDECRTYVLNDGVYMKDVENHPFEKEEYIEKNAESIKSARVFSTRYSSYGDDGLRLIYAGSKYFVDALFNYIWKEIAKEYMDAINKKGDNVGESKDPGTIVDMILHYIENKS